MAPRPCLTCGTPTDGSRCPPHQPRPEARRIGGNPYDRRHRRLAEAAITSWVARNGWVCPGYRCPPHPVEPGGLQGEHIIPRSVRPDLAYVPSNYGVLCQPCNGRKGDRLN